MKMVSTHISLIPGNPFISFIAMLVLSVTLKSNMATEMAARILKNDYIFESILDSNMKMVYTHMFLISQNPFI